MTVLADTPDPAGWPNGRRPKDDVTDIAIRVVGGNNYIAARAGDGVNFLAGAPGVVGTDITANGIATSDPRWQKGLRYLLSTQDDQGVWHVRTRMTSPAPVSPPSSDDAFGGLSAKKFWPTTPASAAADSPFAGGLRGSHIVSVTSVGTLGGAPGSAATLDPHKAQDVLLVVEYGL
jgi:hypothetical protein